MICMVLLGGGGGGFVWLGFFKESNKDVASYYDHDIETLSVSFEAKIQPLRLSSYKND